MALGAGVLRSPRKQKDAWVAAGMACDVADVGAGALAGIRGTLPPVRGRDGHGDGRVLRADERVSAAAVSRATPLDPLAYQRFCSGHGTRVG